jgi:chorismate synthase
MALRFLTAGESHGPALTVIVEGLPAGVAVAREAIDRELRRRMSGHGRGGRMRIEKDAVEILGGVRFGRTIGAPVSLLVRNLDHTNWLEAMSPDGPHPGEQAARAVSRPRPGHADLAGALKYGTHDARDVLERASARETAARTAAGALARALLAEATIEVTSCTVSVGTAAAGEVRDEDFDRLLAIDDDAPMRTLDEAAGQAMIDAVERARKAGDSVGGVFEVLVRGVPPGLGSHVHWDRKLDGRLAGALASIHAVKAVSVGEGIESAARHGSETHDPITYDAGERRFRRGSNRAGGIEGGISNGEMIRVRGYLKPLSTLPRPLPSADLVTKEAFEATRERTDTIPIVAAGVVAEAMACVVIADELLIKFGGDRLQETLQNLAAFRASLREF